MRNVSFRLASESDNEVILGLVNNISMPGDIEVLLQTNPSFFKAHAIKGRNNQTICAVGAQNRLLGIGTRSIMPMYINGQKMDLGYLSNLKIDRDRSNGRLLFKGYEYLRKLHLDDRTPIYLTTVIGSNTRAKKVLKSGRFGLPKYIEFGDFYCAIISMGNRSAGKKSRVKIRKGNSGSAEKILGFLSRLGRQKQFYPAYSRNDFGKFFSNDHYDFSDFYMAYDGNQLKGVLAAWDQTAIKQIVVKKYHGKARFYRPLYNCYCRFKGMPPLPKPGRPLNSFFISFIAIESDDHTIFKALLRAVMDDPHNAKYHYCIVGLHEKDPKLEVIKGLPHKDYTSKVYLVSWANNSDCLNILDNRTPYLEAGLL